MYGHAVGCFEEVDWVVLQGLTSKYIDTRFPATPIITSNSMYGKCVLNHWRGKRVLNHWSKLCGENENGMYFA